MSESSGPGLAVALRKPYLLFVGDVKRDALAKTAFGVRDWSEEAALAQCRLPGCQVDLELPEMTPEVAATAGARSLLIGVAPPGGRLPRDWVAMLTRAIEAGLDVVSGLHDSLADQPGLVDAAARRGVRLIDVRRPRQTFAVATGRRRSGKRLLTVGTDCALGKKYTALALALALRRRGVKADFRATGQTGIMISGAGVAVDAVVADFVAGAAEWLSPDAATDHWDVIEGQGSLFHPAYAGVTLGLLHGSQPDALVLCHDPTRTHLSTLPAFPLPDLDVAAQRFVEAARLTNPQARLVAVSLNTSGLDDDARAAVLAATAQRLHVPCFDPLKSPLDAVVDAVLAS